MTTYFWDYEGGNDSADGLSFANRKLTLGAFTLSAGDVVRCKKSPDPVSIGNGTWTNQNAVVTLASAQTSNVTLCQTSWTANTNVTTGTNSDRRQGSLSTEIDIA